ncbi:uncharacterized protein LOC131597071 [Vicia villosa]|uniref:uncharacterized protein LOC131597071 n=1 Tax=Vicia villosa TaxID=3911 RepID=UPI00273C5A26|nr:uncharacterized protein LOC131597071 [Vicia villosa]
MYQDLRKLFWWSSMKKEIAKFVYSCFGGQISERLGEVAYRIALTPSLANIHNVFHVSELGRYIADQSHIVQLDNVQVRDNLTMEMLPMRIEDQELTQLCGKEIALVKVAWVGPAGDNVTWEIKSQMRDSYLKLFV